MLLLEAQAQLALSFVSILLCRIPGFILILLMGSRFFVTRNIFEAGLCVMETFQDRVASSCSKPKSFIVPLTLSDNVRLKFLL